MASDAKQATVGGAGDRHGSADRRGSIVVDQALASEEDAAVLAKMGWVVACPQLLSLLTSV